MERIFTGIGPGYDAVKDLLFDQYRRRMPEALAALQEGFNALPREGESRLTLRSRQFAYVLDNAPVWVDPQDWFAGHFLGMKLMEKCREGWRKEQGSTLLTRETELLERGKRTGAYAAELDLGHISPGWRFLLAKGLPGILEAAREKLSCAADEDSREFHTAVITCYEAALRLLERLEACARAEAEKSPGFADRMTKLSVCLQHLRTSAPATFYEALQLSYLFHQLIEFEGEWVRSMGSFERNYGPFYEADIAAGRITPEDARELIRYFWMKFFANTRGSGNGKNFYFGGRTTEDRPEVGPLSYLAMELYYTLNQPDPKLSIKLCKDTPMAFKRLVARCLRDGRTNMVLINDDITLQALADRGVEAADLKDYLLIGCYEPAIEGREVACNMCIKYNLAKPVELALWNGRDPLSGEQLGPETGMDFANFEAFYAAYETQLQVQLTYVMDAIRGYEARWAQINPEPFLSGTFADCLENGRDISRAGCRYNNTGAMGGGLANAADSLVAIKQLVFEEKRYTLTQLREILADNFVHYPMDRLYMEKRVPKWGNNQPVADAMARRVADSYTSRVNGADNGRGGRFNASMFTLDYCFSLGHHTGATPDGREAGHYIAKGIGAMTGMDRAGVTAQIQSVASLDFRRIPNGSVLDIYLHPSAVDGEKGIDTMVQLFDTYFAGGGYGIQFNVLNAEDLKKAQKHPEEYATLQVRVCGWNVYFVTLNEEQQNHFIETTMQVL